MSDQFREVTTRSWGSRIMGSFVGVLIGIVLFFGSFPLIFWNEGRSVDRIKTLGEGRGAVVEGVANAIDPTLEGALVHVSGDGAASAKVSDPLFGISSDALRLSRKVEMYQWRENSESKTTKNLGGSETTETVYTYERVWSSSHISSSSFKNSAGHQNPPMPFDSEVFNPPVVSLGAYKLGPSFVDQISGWEDVALSQQDLAALDPSMASSFTVSNNRFYRGNPNFPQVGAVRVSFQQVKPQAISAIGQQKGDALQTYAAKNGTIALLDMGTVPAADMFAAAETENRIITWLIRLGAFLMMWVGLSLVMGPISVIGSVIPFIGSVLGAGTGLVAFVLALVLTAVTAAIAWIAVRPIIGITLLVIAALFFFGGFKWLKGKAQSAAPAPGASGSQFGRPAA